MVDPRNSELGIGFIDIMGYEIRAKAGQLPTGGKPWQNLWVRFATD